MTFRSGDTIYPHHPDTVETWDGDLPVNNRPGDVWYLLVDDKQQDTSWNIVIGLIQDTSWHIFPATYEFIAEFILNFIDSSYSLHQKPELDFTVCPVKTNYRVASVVDNNIGIKEITGKTAFSINQITSDFTLTGSVQNNFKITRVLNNTRDV